MTTIQLKTEIQKALDDAPVNVLPEILDYIKQLHLSDKKTKFENNLNKVLAEDRELFERLAQ